MPVWGSRLRRPLRSGLDLWRPGDRREEVGGDRPMEQFVQSQRYETDPPRDSWRLGVFLHTLGLRRGIWQVREFCHMFPRFLSRNLASHRA